MTNGRIDRVIVIPRNGYANRLQAWASAQALADHVGAPLEIVWEAEAVATTPADAIFSPDLITEHFVSGSLVEDLLGMPHVDFPRYLTALPDRRVIVLAGHDRGEQAFMADLSQLLSTLTAPTTLVIIAGGLFQLDSSTDAESARRDVYRGLAWSARLNELVTAAREDHPTFAALHVRQTDRSRQAPSDAAIRAGLRHLRDLVPERSLLICADTDAARRRWAEESRTLGFQPWSVEGVHFDRGSSDNGLYALLDWRLMASATGVVHPNASTFSTEAVVAGDVAETSVALRAGALTQAGRGLRAAVETVTGRIRR